MPIARTGDPEQKWSSSAPSTGKRDSLGESCGKYWHSQEEAPRKGRAYTCRFVPTQISLHPECLSSPSGHCSLPERARSWVSPYSEVTKYR